MHVLPTDRCLRNNDFLRGTPLMQGASFFSALPKGAFLDFLTKYDDIMMYFINSVDILGFL